MIKICLCDDDEMSINLCKTLIKQVAEELNIIISAYCFPSGESLLFELDEDCNKFDILVIDMLMEKLDGIETSKKLREKGFVGEIIFISSSKEYAIDSFEVEPLYYVVKEEGYEKKLAEVLQRAMNHIEQRYTKKMMITTKKKNVLINLDSILYIECINKKIFIHLTTGEVEECSYTLGSMEEKVSNQGFIRCHKSYIVNSQYVESFTKLECRMKQGAKIPIGRKYSNSFKEELMQYELNHIVL